ncbi:B3 domain-containing transcription factor VRN1-like isoform X2 [Trifolium pratense]|uniref:B3 domain-containing transcription factor VRN1-like isoform X2 n=1 Tax=Trifolium pratense TaxID=57577 RepID=UPI001E69702C|nr:B3 domain-containing transcription factor VRN1-like isoform X2 [Trifolium pratense]
MEYIHRFGFVWTLGLKVKGNKCFLYSPPTTNTTQSLHLHHHYYHMSFENYGRGSDAKGIHFYQTIQLPQLQDQNLMIPRNFVERYWKDVSNPISLKLPNGSDCKMCWVQQGEDIWIQNWKRFARSLRCGDLLVFQYKGGSDFHVIIFDDSKLEIDYSSMRYNDDQEEEESENTEQPLKKKKINSNGSVVTPQGTSIDRRKINMNAIQQKVSEANSYSGGMGKTVKKCAKTKDGNERSCTSSNPSFTLTLPRSYVEGGKIRLRIPTQFSKEYMNELLQMNATIRSVGEDRTWDVKLIFDERKRNFEMRTGWKSFSQEHNLQIGDVCKFEMTQRRPLSFTITINRATKEPCPEQFQENQRVHEKSETTPVKDMEYVGNFEEGLLRSCAKTHGLKNSESPNLHNTFKVFVTSLFMLVVPSEFLKKHNISSGNSVELKVGEGTWFVEVSFNQHLDYGWFTKGWPEFVRECKVKIGDTCLFEIVDLENHVFKVSVILDV